MVYIHFEEFWKLTNFFYYGIGLVPYENAKAPDRRLLRFIFTIQLIPLITCGIIFGYNVYIRLRNGDTLSTIIIMTYLSFMINSAAKIYYIHSKRVQLQQLVDELESMYPLKGSQQRLMNVSNHLNVYKRIGLAYAFIFMLVIWLFNLYPLIEYCIFELWLQQRSVGKQLPYLMDLPWNYGDNFWFVIICGGQCLGACMSGCGQVGPDLMMAAITTQVLMHCEQLQRELAKYKGVGLFCKDQAFLKGIIKKHEQIYRLVDLINEIFDLPIFVSYFSSAFIICFEGFQITVVGNKDVLVKMFFFLTCSFLQVYLICWYSQALIDATEDISKAAYNHAWLEANQSYKKTLLLIMRRAQKPAQLKGTAFLLISQTSVTDLLSLSYNFFALLRNLYED